MNLVVISPPILRTPPEGDRYGGMERAAWWLTKGLCERGHWVDLIAREDSQQPPNGRLFKASDDDDIPRVVATMESVNGKSDVYIDFSHNHTLSVARPEFPQINTHSIMSLMGTGLNLVCISHGQAQDKFGQYESVVIHYGLDLDEYPLYTGRRDRYLLYLGQMIPEKRVEWCCEVAVRTDRPLKAYGPWWGPPEYHKMLRAYEQNYPKLISFNNEIGGQEKIELLQHAYALIHPPGAMGWCEAGAIVALESLAVGTPVIASDNGCLPEYINDESLEKAGHKVGAVCKTLDEMVEAVRANVPTYCFADWCRYRAEDFSMALMSERYEQLAIEVARGARWNVR